MSKEELDSETAGKMGGAGGAGERTVEERSEAIDRGSTIS